MSTGPNKEQIRRALLKAAKSFAEELKAAVGTPSVKTFITGRGNTREITVVNGQDKMFTRVRLLRASNGEAHAVRWYAVGHEAATERALEAARSLGK